MNTRSRKLLYLRGYICLYEFSRRHSFYQMETILCIINSFSSLYIITEKTMIQKKISESLRSALTINYIAQLSIDK